MLQDMYSNLGIKQGKNGWRILIPDEYRIGHEAHFQKVTEKYLQYMAQGKLMSATEEDEDTEFLPRRL